MEAVAEQPIAPAPSEALAVERYPRLRRVADASLAFAARYMGVGLSSGATAFLAFLTLTDLVKLPAAPTHRVLLIFAMVLVAGLVGLATNAPNIMRIRRNEAENTLYRQRSKHLAERLRDAMEEVVQGWAAGLKEGLALEGSLDVAEKLEIELHVFVPSDGVYRVIASSAEGTSPVRRIELLPAEGLVARAYEKKNPLVVVLDSQGPGTLWSRKGRNMGPQPPLRDENQDRCHSRLQWVYATPIYESRDGVFQTDRPLGVLTVDGLNTTSGELYFKPEFQDVIEGVAAQLGPYLNALASLLPTALR